MADSEMDPFEAAFTGPVIDECPNQARNLAASVELIKPISASGFGMPIGFPFAHVQYENAVFSYNHLFREQLEFSLPRQENLLPEKHSLRQPLALSIRKVLVIPVFQWIRVWIKILFLESRLGITIHGEC